MQCKYNSKFYSKTKTVGSKVSDMYIYLEQQSRIKLSLGGSEDQSLINKLSLYHFTR